MEGENSDMKYRERKGKTAMIFLYCFMKMEVIDIEMKTIVTAAIEP